MNDLVDNIKKDIGNYDVFVPAPIFMPYSIKDHYYKYHIGSHYEIMGQIIEEKYPELKVWYDNTSISEGLIIGNMFVMKREIFNDYCEKMFSVLEEVENRIEIPEDSYQRRVIGFLAERFTTIYINSLTNDSKIKIKCQC